MALPQLCYTLQRIARTFARMYTTGEIISPDVILIMLFTLMFLNAFNAFPSEPLLFAIGYKYRTSDDGFRLALVELTTAFVAYLIGSAAFYYVTVWIGPRRLEALWRAFARIPIIGRLFRWDYVLAINTHADKWPFVTYGAFRNLTPIRSVVSAVAGLNSFNIPRFMLYTALGSVPWFLWWPAAGYLLFTNKLYSLGLLALVAVAWALLHSILRRLFISHFKAPTA